MTQHVAWLFLASRSAMPYSCVVIHVRYLLEPVAQARGGRAFEHTAAPEHGGGANDFDEVDRIDDPDASAGRRAP